MALTEGQIKSVWEKKIGAEVRSLYFGDLATRYTRRKQIITGASFFLSSGAAAMLAAKAGPDWIPLTMAAITAFLTAYSISVGLDRKVATMAKLHYEWNSLAAELDRLWNHWHEDDAESRFADVVKRAADVSQMAATEAPYDERLMGKWQDRVVAQYGMTIPA